MNQKIKVLIVDDSALMRKLISNILSKDPEIEIVDTAMNGLFALKKIKKNEIDVILLDIEMPEMNGLEFLKMKRDLKIDIPVIVLSSLGAKRPQVTMEAIELGAKDFIIKPSGSISMDIDKKEEEILASIKKYGGQKNKTPLNSAHYQKEIEKIIQEKLEEDKKNTVQEVKQQTVESYMTPDITHLTKEKKISHIEMILIGISTGGPAALRQLFSEVKNKKYPILIVQHMPPGFTKEFSKSLDKISSLSVKEAEQGEIIKAGWVYIAPGDKHLSFVRKQFHYQVELLESHPVNGHKPSVEVLFESAYHLDIPVTGIIMTGMGKDGAHAIKKLHDKGNLTIAQSPEDCVVFGMPRVAAEIGGIDKILKIEEIAELINVL